jgi:hypothetical protein
MRSQRLIMKPELQLKGYGFLCMLLLHPWAEEREPSEKSVIVSIPKLINHGCALHGADSDYLW